MDPKSKEVGIILLLDRMAQRYGMLPIDILTKATTFDMVIMDISLTMEDYYRNKEKPGYVPDYDTEELVKLHRAQ